ncbi:formate dehydrogenase accessory sulfurtransferase FdhD [Bowmanella denitrificans]|uniref:Sulfur carrier protein FdhD n=1 Tax=Bowmanella denitrificans TaxID=366582 RepID=A0ABN0WSP6_9ALTE
MSAQDHTNTSQQPECYQYQEVSDNQNTGQFPLAAETALAISYNGISHAVMMISPGDVEDFVLGFSLSNGIIDVATQIHDMVVSESDGACLADVTLSNKALWILKQSRRQLAGTSGCGICGVAALEQALPALTPLIPAPLPAPELFLALRSKITAVQQQARCSGAMHAALYLDGDGHIQLCREDIGRHNALDKLIGALLRKQLNPHTGMVVLTSRGSLELVQKAVRAKVGTLVTLAAPTALSVDWARRYNLNLLHLPRQSAPRLYSPAHDK